MTKPSNAKSATGSELVRELALVLRETDLTEIAYEVGDLRVRLSRGGTVIAAAPQVMSPQAMSITAAPSPAPSAPADLSKHPGAVKAPMVGVAYMGAEPGAAPFVSIGDTVREGDTLLLIEAMKTFNAVRAPRAGKVTRILVNDGSPIEYGEPLLLLE